MKRLPVLRLSSHSASYAIIAGIVAQLVVLTLLGCLLILGGYITADNWWLRRDEFPWAAILAVLSIGPQVTLVLRQGNWIQKLSTAAAYVICSFAVLYILCGLCIIMGVLIATGSAIMLR